MSIRRTAVVIGAGPAGISAAGELLRLGRDVSVIEQDPQYVGGLARTVEHCGFRFDLGAHRFFSKNHDVRIRWSEQLGTDLLDIQRLTRIHFRGKYFYYPLRFGNVLRQLGTFESARCLLSYAAARTLRKLPETSFEDWVTNRFGRRLFSLFFRTYTEKVWGMRCDQISADWAAQRIRGLSFYRAVVESLGLKSSKNVITTLSDRFSYPRLGSGMMWESACSSLTRSGVNFHMGQEVVRLRRESGIISSVQALNTAGELVEHTADDFIASMPLSSLALSIDPPLPEAVMRAARDLKYRGLIIVALIVDAPHVFPDHWVYIHDPSVHVARIANFKNWSADMVPDSRKTGLALDYFSSEGDALWSRTDDELLSLARNELEQLGMASSSSIIHGRVIRAPQAYPVFDEHYKSNVSVIRSALAQLKNLHVVGRNGMHKYNNQDHSMLTGIVAARAANGEQVDPWKVNSDASYLEEEQAVDDSARLIPQAARQSSDQAR